MDRVALIEVGIMPMYVDVQSMLQKILILVAMHCKKKHTKNQAQFFFFKHSPRPLYRRCDLVDWYVSSLAKHPQEVGPSSD